MNHMEAKKCSLAKLFDVDVSEMPKPLLKKVNGEWWCVGGSFIRIHYRPESAYYRWVFGWVTAKSAAKNGPRKLV